MGIYDVVDGRPHPKGYGDASLASGRGVRVYVLVSDDDNQDRILDTADKLGAKILWRDHYWGEFNGFCGAFVDPWGTEVVLWTKGGENPTIPTISPGCEDHPWPKRKSPSRASPA